MIEDSALDSHPPHYCPPDASTAYRLPILVERGSELPLSSLQQLLCHPRLEVLVLDERARGWQSHARRVASAVVVATALHPFAAMSRYTRKPAGHLVMAVTTAYAWHVEPLVACGATAVLLLPAAAADVNRVVALVSEPPAVSCCPVPPFLLDPVSICLWYRGTRVRLSNREFAILRCLSDRVGEPVPADDILRSTWDGGTTVPSRKLLDAHVSHIRSKLTAVKLECALTTIRRYGYILHAGPGGGTADSRY